MNILKTISDAQLRRDNRNNGLWYKSRELHS